MKAKVPANRQPAASTGVAIELYAENEVLGRRRDIVGTLLKVALASASAHR